MEFSYNIDKVKNNNLFRNILYTDENLQFVTMSVKKEIEMEKHSGVQFFYIVDGFGMSITDTKKIVLSEGSILIIPAGKMHRIVNIGESPLKLYTIYSPPQHY